MVSGKPEENDIKASCQDVPSNDNVRGASYLKVRGRDLVLSSRCFLRQETSLRVLHLCYCWGNPAINWHPVYG